MNEKTISFSVNTFRGRNEKEYDTNEFVTFDSYSKNLEKAMQELEDYLHFAKNSNFHSIYILMTEDEDSIWVKSFSSDEEFFNFKKKVEDARIDNYKEWLLSNYKDGKI